LAILSQSVTELSTVEPSEDESEVKFSDATAELLPLFREVVAKCPEVAKLGCYRIKFLFAHKSRMSKGRIVLGTSKIFPAKEKLWHDWDALITFDLTFWESQPTAHRPLMLHELLHLDVNETTGLLTTVGHDIEEHFAVLKYYGDWLGELKVANSGQLELALNLDRSL
jgi:hypothetical protein